ncbi:MAG: SoxR reducing system RseC family protein [Candidatus Auribacterota bacterium]|jgi:positive regulator of sigma E activity|nr:SoxR reducing system RseC family protein [Candidatus Auribacterota bacterium]
MALRECGEVVEIKDGMMSVRINPPEMCEGCTSCAGTQRKERSVTVPYQEGIREGDEVWVEAVSGDMLKAVLLVFVLPTAGLFAGIAVAAYIFSSRSELVYFACGIIGAILPFFVVKYLTNKYIPFRRNITLKQR